LAIDASPLLYSIDTFKIKLTKLKHNHNKKERTFKRRKLLGTLNFAHHCAIDRSEPRECTVYTVTFVLTVFEKFQNRTGKKIILEELCTLAKHKEVSNVADYF